MTASSSARRLRIVGVALLVAFGATAAVAAPARAFTACTDPNYCPLANDDDYTVAFGTTLTVDAAHGLLANDEGSTGTRVLTGEFDTDRESFPGGAIVRVRADGSFTYTPNPIEFGGPFSGEDSFFYTIANTHDTSEDYAAVFIHVPGVPGDDTYRATMNTQLTVGAPGVFANDTGLDPTSVTFPLQSQEGGTVDDALDGAFVYTPPPDFQGIDTFTYSAWDYDFDDQYSATVTLDVEPPAPPDAPTNVSATGGNRWASVSWTAPYDNGAPITTYTITASPGGTFAVVDGSQTAAAVTGLSNGATYTFTVHATNSVGDGAESIASNAVVPDDGLPPKPTVSAPAATTALALSFKVSWSATDDSGIARYDVQRQSTGWNRTVAPWTAWLTGTSARTATYTGTNGFTYCFRARARDLGGHLSGWSAPRCTAVPLKSSQLSYSPGWTHQSLAGAFGGTLYTTKLQGAKVTRTGIHARQLALIVSECSSCGAIQIRWNGAVVKSVNLHAPTTRRKQVVGLVTFPTSRTGTLTVTDISVNGRPVILEGLAILNR